MALATFRLLFLAPLWATSAVFTLTIHVWAHCRRYITSIWIDILHIHRYEKKKPSMKRIGQNGKLFGLHLEWKKYLALLNHLYQWFASTNWHLYSREMSASFEPLRDWVWLPNSLGMLSSHHQYDSLLRNCGPMPPAFLPYISGRSNDSDLFLMQTQSLLRLFSMIHCSHIMRHAQPTPQRFEDRLSTLCSNTGTLQCYDPL